MKTPEASRALAESLVAIGRAAGVRTEALITRMDAPLGREVGNANEVIESIETLKGSGPADLEQLSVLLAARMLRRGRCGRRGSGRRGARARGDSPRARASRSFARSSSIRAATRASSTTTRVCRRRRTARSSPRRGAAFVERARGRERRPRGGRARRGAGTPRRRDRPWRGDYRRRAAGHARCGRAIGSWRFGTGAAAGSRRRARSCGRPCRSPTRRRSRGRSSSTRSSGRFDVFRQRGFMSDPHAPAGAPPLKRAPYDSRDVMVLGGAAAAAAVCALVAQYGGLPKLQPLVGLIVIMSVAYAMSTNRRAIDRRTVAWGLALQVIFALLVLKTGARAGGVPAARRRDQSPARLRVRRVELRVRSARRQGSLAADHDDGARGRGREVRRGLRLSGAADDHLHRRAVRDPLLLRRHAGHRAPVRGDDAAGDARRRARNR